jgi:DNA-binding PadR family transcriptional regulator
MAARTAHDFLPLTHASLQLMLAVTAGHCHGYAIRKEVERRTNGQVRLWPTSLYRTISALMDGGLLEEDPGQPVSDDDRNRRLYRLTPLGRDVLSEEVARLEAIVARARGLEVSVVKRG